MALPAPPSIETSALEIPMLSEAVTQSVTELPVPTPTTYDH